MDHHSHLLQLLEELLLLFAIAGILIPVLKRLHVSPVLGYLLCGVCIGPYGFGLWVEAYPWIRHIIIEDSGKIQILGELGIIGLLFMIGLELSFRRLKELKHYVLGLGSLQILISTVVIALIAYQFGNSGAASVILGASLALSSTAIIMQLLHEQHMMNRQIGVLCFSVLLMQDLAVIPILIMASAFAGNEVGNIWMVLMESLALAALVIVGIYTIGMRGLRPMMRSLHFSNRPEWLTAFVLFLVVGSALFTQLAGLSVGLGAFLAGLLIAETEFRHEVEVILEPLKSLLLGIFFLSIGMQIDVSAVLDNPFWIAASVVGIAVIKSSIIYPLMRVFGVPAPRSVQASVMLAQPGEFAFLILSVGMVSGLIPAPDAQFFLLVVAISMLVTPLLFKLSEPLRQLVYYYTLDQQEEGEQSKKEGCPVIIAGFGRIGQLIGAVMEQHMIPYIAIEHDAERVSHLKKQGYNVIYGEATRAEHWRRLQATDARAVVITIDHYKEARTILKLLRTSWPHLPVMMRVDDAEHMPVLYEDGAHYVVPELEESSLQLAKALLEQLDIQHDDTEEFIRSAIRGKI